MIKKILMLLITANLFMCGCQGPRKQAEPERTDPAPDQRMQWWRDARFGMFIHWGLYAIPAGTYQGKPVESLGEWIMFNAQIPIEEYEKFAPQFNPVKYDPEKWVQLAKDAGMKYIVITSKHHDGFCLWDSKLTEYDVVDATPYGKDLLKPLAEACKRHGIRLCFYHSIMDWHHPDYLPRRKWDTRPADEADMDRYVAYMKGQIKELLTNYGDIAVMWFDGEWEPTWTHERGVDLYNYVRSLDPDIIVNNRVDKGRQGMKGINKDDGIQYRGDFGTPEQEIPATGIPGKDWETCMTMNDTWGYKSDDKNWKSTRQILHHLVDIASKGGNFLLNVGPTAEGEIPNASVRRLKRIGKWMDRYGESIYGTGASIFESLPWGRCTVKDNKIYLHVFDWPKDGKLLVPPIEKKIQKCYTLKDPKQLLKYTSNKSGVTIDIPWRAPNRIDSVIVIETEITK